MKRGSQLWRWLLARLGTLGWGTFMAGALLGLVEWTGLGTSWVHRILSVRLAALDGDLHLGSVDFRWLEPGLVLEEVALVTEKEVLAAEHLHVRFGWHGSLALTPTRVHLRGARVVLDPALASGVRGLLDVEGNPRARPDGSGLPFLPEILVEDLTLLVETGDDEQVEVLHVDLALMTESDQPKVFGRVQTPRQRAQGASGSIRLSGGVDTDGILALRGRALDLEITPQDIPNVPELDSVRGWQPQGTLDLEANIVLDLLNESAPKAAFTGRLEDGSLLPPGAIRSLEGLNLLYGLTFAPEAEEWLWDTSAWEGVATASGEFALDTFQAGGLLGDSARNDSHFEAWLELDTVDLKAPLRELLPEARWVDDLHTAAAPAGSFSARVSTRLLKKETEDEETSPQPEMLVHVDVTPDTKVTYHGWPTEDPDREVVGFPVPATVTEGEITYAYTRRFARRGILSLELDLEQAGGPCDVRYLKWSAPIDTPPFASAEEEHLIINVSRLSVDERLEHAFKGLDPILGEGTVWRKYAPTGGSLGVELYLARLPGASKAGFKLDLDVREVGCTVEEFPVPVSQATGWIQVVGESDADLALSWNLASTSGPPELQAVGRNRSRELEGEEDRERVLSIFEVSAQHVDVNGPVYSVLPQETREGIAELALDGMVSANLATYASGSYRRSLEVHPEGDMSAAPASFPTHIDDLKGSLRLAWNDSMREEESVEIHAWIPGVEGMGSGGEHISLNGMSSPDGWSGTLFGAGLAASSWNADDVFSVASSEEGELSLRGVVDIEAAFTRPALPDEEGTEAILNTELSVVLRSNALMNGGTPLLEELEGIFTMTGGHIEAPLIEGRLGETVVLLEDMDLWSEPDELTMSTKISASGVPLDTVHMEALLDEELLTSLVEELGLRGSVDVDQGTLEVRVPRDGDRSVRFRGYLTLTDMALEAGLPVIVQSARAHVHDLIVEDGELRGWGRIENLYGDCFQSELGPVSALVSYVGGVLAIEDFAGSFEHGTIRPLDRDSDPLLAVRGRPALRIELHPPFPYQASIAVDDIDAARWLEGLSSDAVTSTGTLSVEADLEGNLGTLVATRGQGSIHLQRSKLWSIPLFRELLREFGLDHTVMFDEVRFDFDLDDEVVTMDNLELHSPLLKLVGEGTLDMMGRLNHNLEVHYSIVDKIAPLRRLFYLVQNLFVSVSIQGDLARPLVRLNTGLFSLFREEPEVKLSLPLPGLSPLPPRF